MSSPSRALALRSRRPCQNSGPPLLAALVVGLFISILQAVTQINEMTLVFVPKIAAVFLVILLMGSWMLEQAMAFGTQSFESISNINH